jgi:hypothetical protein
MPLPVQSRTAILPLISEVATKIPLLSAAFGKLSVLCEADIMLPLILEANEGLPVLSEADNYLPFFSKTDIKLNEADVKPPSHLRDGGGMYSGRLMDSFLSSVRLI